MECKNIISPKDSNYYKFDAVHIITGYHSDV